MDFTKEELYWIERQADLIAEQLFREFSRLIQFYNADWSAKTKSFFDSQIEQLIKGHTFLSSLRSKFEKERE